MKNFKDTFYGFICFLITCSFTIGFGILIYTLAINQEKWIVILSLLGVILFTSLIFTIIDIIRRKIMVKNPLYDILYATKQMSKGNFNISLKTNHSYLDYDEFDLIKEDLNKMAQELSKNEVLKNDFIANVSHELKTPISIIKNYAKLLNNNNLSKEDKTKYLENLQNACDKLNNLITNILKLNKLENQQLNPTLKKLNISELLENQIISFESILEKKEITLNCDIQENLFINSEESYLEIIFNNLISNAIKFSNQKGVIDISLTSINNNFIVKIKDYGCGMDSETGKHIFDKFYQGDTSHASEGNGLGLALVKKVIDIIGGSISVESKLNEGTTFIVTVKEN